ncbi:hypothetical protein A9264_13580 [Vibrio sp. UCD-FRSSP16_10]|uniref:DUF1254 domain-containing protein n=1 Tax=unclassified Vibrio TaxID=2614977 RepID=UPI0008022BA0|nr:MULTISPECIES: DUF1254 domain-containing protein [unclassified Vibrio]OBT14802.1 hypothetical protein A9260_13795 [Vibrio sp. UCD-FRSSP16_30]OBT20091.1 hypothetical protein A9264_13580 [Vibrio sp. UCD-FRSSP16_10]
MKKTVLALTLGFTVTSLPAISAEVSTYSDFFSSDGVIATADTYPTLESSHQFLKNQELVGVNEFLHKRHLTPTDKQPVVRMNRDTYYSFAVIDVSKGATITMPEIEEGKYMSIQGVTEDHRIQTMHYGAGTFSLSTHTGSHLYVVVRLDATYTEAEAREIQDKMTIQANSNDEFVAEQVNKASFDKVEMDLKAQMPQLFKKEGASAISGMFTDPNDKSKELYTDEKYTVGAAIGWGGAQLEDNIYEVSGNFPADKCHQATFEDPKNQAFWSITVYDKAGFMFDDVANLSSNTATKNADGTYTISFGCGPDAINNIKTKNDSGVFNLGIRHYIPSQKVKDGFRILPTVKPL